MVQLLRLPYSSLVYLEWVVDRDIRTSTSLIQSLPKLRPIFDIPLDRFSLRVKRFDDCDFEFKDLENEYLEPRFPFIYIHSQMSNLLVFMNLV